MKKTLISDICMDLNEQWLLTHKFIDKWWEDYWEKEKSIEICDIIESNKIEIRLALIANSAEYNNWKEKALKNFLRSYLLKLSISNDKELLSKLYYYLNVYHLSETWWSDKLDEEILWNVSWFTKIEILYELLFYNTVLPDYKNQEDFNEKMLVFLTRLENSINWNRNKEYPIIITPINPQVLWEYMIDTNKNLICGNKKIESGMIKNISYRFFLWEKLEINEVNEFYFSIFIDSEYITREDFLSYLSDVLWLQKRSDKEFIYKSDANFNFSIYVQENFYLNDDDFFNEEWWENIDTKNLWFEVRIYAWTKRNLEIEEDLANICYSYPRLLEEFLKNIYKNFSKNWDDIFPEKVEIFNLEDYINFDSWSDYYGNWDDFWGSTLWSIILPQSKNIYIGKNIKIEDVSLSNLILEEDLKKQIESLIKMFKNREYFLKNWWSLPTWMLLSWDPGWWKTTIARILANESDAGFIHIEWNLEWSYVWESANNLVKRIKKAKSYIDKNNKSAIIFIDEAEALFPKRWKEDHKEWMMSVLLQEMDWIDWKYKGKITFIFATNRKDILDKAVISRIEKHLEIPMPSKENLQKIVKLHLDKKIEKTENGMYDNIVINLDTITEKIVGKSGRFVKNLIQNAHNYGLEMKLEDENFVMYKDVILDCIKYTKQEENKKESIWFKA